MAASENNAPHAAGTTSAATAPASTSGTNTNETMGIARQFTASPTRDTPPKTAQVSGASARVTANCTRAKRRVRVSGVSAVASIARITPTAMNDNQNPAASGANTSSSSTAASASDQVRPAPTWRAPSRASAKMASISQVRWVGTENPASNE